MRGIHLLLWLGALLAACSEQKAPRAPGGGLRDGDACSKAPDGIVCADDVALTCEDGAIVASERCEEQGLRCDDSYGCISCQPYFYACEENAVYLCEPDGRKLTFVEQCEGGLSCSPRGCRDLCAEAAMQRSYLGCEYWPVFASNSQLDPLFQPAVVVANPNLVPAKVTITKGDEKIVETIPPSSSQSILLRFDARLKGGNDMGSALVTGGAHHLVSSVPVTVHQFNPLLFEVGEDCSLGEMFTPADDDQCNSFTNDASLLLPSHVLSREDEGISYIAISRPSFMQEDNFGWRGLPGFVAVVGVADRAVRVEVRASAFTMASLATSDPKDPKSEPVVSALEPGKRLEVSLGPSDVLLLRSRVPDECEGETAMSLNGRVCDPGKKFDLTGTEIRADGAVQVVSGHDCTNVPFDRVACDHLEETMFPVETWGKRVIVTRPRLREGTKYRLRVVSGADDNRITFDPQVSEPVELDRGELFEVGTTKHVIVRGTKRLAVAQFLEGQNAADTVGDPSMSLAIPVDQYRSSYNFLSPDTYTINYVNVISERDDVVRLDGELIESWENIADGAYRVATVKLRSAGPHVVASDNAGALGLVLYGYGAYTSYMLPGGLDLQIIGEPL